MGHYFLDTQYDCEMRSNNSLNHIREAVFKHNLLKLLAYDYLKRSDKLTIFKWTRILGHPVFCQGDVCCARDPVHVLPCRSFAVTRPRA